MRVPNATHESHPWRIREITQDFVLEDVWALPAWGGADDFQALLDLMASSDPISSGSLPTRAAAATRGRWRSTSSRAAGSGRDTWP